MHFAVSAIFNLWMKKKSVFWIQNFFENIFYLVIFAGFRHLSIYSRKNNTQKQLLFTFRKWERCVFMFFFLSFFPWWVDSNSVYMNVKWVKSSSGRRFFRFFLSFLLFFNFILCWFSILIWCCCSVRGTDRDIAAAAPESSTPKLPPSLFFLFNLKKRSIYYRKN